MERNLIKDSLNRLYAKQSEVTLQVYNSHLKLAKGLNGTKGSMTDLLDKVQRAFECEKAKKNKILSKKFESMIGEHNVEKNEMATVEEIPEFLVNMSSEVFTEEQLRLLNMGLNYAVNSNTAPKEEIVIDMEAAINFLPRGKKEFVRERTVNLLKKKSKVTRKGNKQEMETLKQLNQKPVFYLKADKGNKESITREIKVHIRAVISSDNLSDVKSFTIPAKRVTAQQQEQFGEESKKTSGAVDYSSVLKLNNSLKTTSTTANQKGQQIATDSASATDSQHQQHQQFSSVALSARTTTPPPTNHHFNPPHNNKNNFPNNFNRNFAKIRQYDSDVSPRPRRPFPNDSSSRYYTKGDVIGQGRNIVESNRNSSLTSRSEGGVGGGVGRSSQNLSQPSYPQIPFRFYRGNSSPDKSTSPATASPPITRSPPPQSHQYFGGGAGSARNYENGKLNGYGESNHNDDDDEYQYSTNTSGRNENGRGRSSGDVGGAGTANNCLERGLSDPLKTEAPKQPGPESRVPGRDNTVPPASRRWVPPSLRPQHGLTQEAKNDAIFRKVRGILNKLTPEKFQELSDELLKIDLNSTVILNGVIYLIFEKALDEPKYSSMYAQLCKRLSKEAPNFEPPRNTCTFLRLLLNVCRDKFNNRSTTSDIVNHDGPLTPEEEEKRHVAKQRMLGNVKFIGEISKLHMLSENILHTCIQQLLDRKSECVTLQDKCEDMECLCQLIRTCGKNLDTEQGKKLMDQYFEKMEQRSNSQKYPPRIRFMLRDVIELRNNNWIPRKVATTEGGPVPIRQIRADDENLIRPPYMNRNRDMRNNERDSDNWMNRFPLNLQSGYNDMFNSFGGVSSPSHMMSSNSYNNNNRHHNERNNQNNNRHNNYNNRYNNKHNNHNQHNNSHNNSSYSNMMNNKDLAPRFKRNLITATQDPVENLQMRPVANSLLFKANVNIKTPSLPITTPPPSIQSTNSYSSSNSTNINNSTPSSNSIQHQARPTSAPASDISQTSIHSNISLSQNSMKNSSTQSIGSGQNQLNSNVMNKDSNLSKQSSTEKIEKKQAKKEKGPSKEEVLKKVQTFLKENLMVDNNENDDKNMDDIVNSFYELKVPDKFMKEACVCIFNEIIDKSEQQYDRVIEFLQQLRKENKVPTNSMLEAFRQLINKMSEKEITIPRITTLVATFLARAVNSKICKLADVASYTKGGQHYPLFLLVLQQLHKIMGRNLLSDLFTESKVNLMTTLPEADRNKDRMAEILDDRNLSFLYPLLKLQAEMWKQIQADPNPQAFYKWIKGNVDSKYYTDSGFITALMTVILKYVVQDSFPENADFKQNPDKSQMEKEQALLIKYHNILNVFLHGKYDLQLVGVYALQVYCYNLGFPKGMLCRWFKNLYEGNVIEEEPFVRWKEEVTEEYPGKGEALFQVNAWLTWLEQAESEDED